MKEKKFPLTKLYSFLKNIGEFDLCDEIKNKDFDISTSRRGFAITRLQEEQIFNKFLNHLQTTYPNEKYLIKEAINKYNNYESVPEAEYIDLCYKGKTRFTPAEIKKLRFYVYELIDPDNNKTFYVGKGKANRIYKHLKYALKGDPSEKSHKIRKILHQGSKPLLKIVKSGMSEDKAYQYENILINKYGINNLTNIQSGISKML